MFLLNAREGYHGSLHILDYKKLLSEYVSKLIKLLD